MATKKKKNKKAISVRFDEVTLEILRRASKRLRKNRTRLLTEAAREKYS